MMSTQFSRYVAVPAAFFTAGVAAWVMVSVGRDGGRARMGDLAYLRTAVLERMAIGGAWVPEPDEGVSYASWPTCLTNGALAAAAAVERTNDVLSAWIPEAHRRWGVGNAALVAGPIADLPILADLVGQYDWVVPGLWPDGDDVEFETDPWDYDVSRLGLFEPPTNWPAATAWPSTNWTGYAARAVPTMQAVRSSTAFSVYCPEVARFVGEGDEEFNETSAAAALAAAESDYAVTNYPAASASGFLPRAGWSYSVSGYPSEDPYYWNASVDMHVTDWPVEPVAVAPHIPPRFYAYGHPDCVVSQVWAVFEAYDELSNASANDPTASFNMAGYVAAAQDIVEGWTGHGYSYLLETALVTNRVRIAWAEILTPTESDDPLYPAWTWEPPSLPALPSAPVSGFPDNFRVGFKYVGLQWVVQVRMLAVILVGNFETYPARSNEWEAVEFEDRRLAP